MITETTWSRARRLAAPEPACRWTRGPGACGSGSSSGSGWPRATPERCGCRPRRAHDERRQLGRRLPHLDDVVLGHWYDGMSTLRLFTVKWPCLTNCRAMSRDLASRPGRPHCPDGTGDLEELLTRLAGAVGLLVVRCGTASPARRRCGGPSASRSCSRYSLSLAGRGRAGRGGTDGTRTLRPSPSSRRGRASSSRDGSSGSTAPV